MNVMKNLFQRNLRIRDIHFTEVTVLSPGAFSGNKGDLTGFAVKQSGQNNTVAPSGDKRLFCECRVSPMKDAVVRQSEYTKEDLKRIADMFLVSYTHSTNELTSYEKRMSRKNTKGARKIFKQIHKIIS